MDAMYDSILFYRPDHIGDYLLTTPAIHVLKKSFPDIRLILAAGDWNLPLIKGNPYIDEVLPLNLPWMERYDRKNWRKTAEEIGVIRSFNFPVILNLRKALRESLVSLAFGGGKRWGFRVPKSGWINHRRISYDPGKHIVDNYLNLIRALGASGNHEGLEIFLSGEERTAPLAAFNIRRPFVVVAPGAGHKPKMWRADCWHLLVKWLLSEGIPNILITGGAADDHLGNAIAAGQSGPVMNLAGRISLRELAGVIGAAEFLITVDSAAMHIGAAMNIPLVALFGPTNPANWGPYPADEKKRVIRAGSMEAMRVGDVQKAVLSLMRCI